uniref:Uncharacterized protein n=1 Tax=Arundo donax TaxID=35708 RepID=A0A0A8ZXH7_ARUDO
MTMHPVSADHGIPRNKFPMHELLKENTCHPNQTALGIHVKKGSLQLVL